MNAYTSRDRYDEGRRFSAVFEQMGAVRVDADGNEQVRIQRTDVRRRSGDVAEGSPDDGFRVTDRHLLDPVTALDGWEATPLPAGDARAVVPLLQLARRDLATLPRVVRSRGHIALARTLPRPVDLLRLPLRAGGTFAASAVVLRIRFVRPPTDDEIVDVQVRVVDIDGVHHDVLALGDIASPAGGGQAEERSAWRDIEISLDRLDPLRRVVDGTPRLVLAGWGLVDVPPRADIFIDALEVIDPALGDDVVLRGGDGTVAGAGRLYLNGWRTFIEHDWRYRTQPDLPSPPPIEAPAPRDASAHMFVLDLHERPIHAWQDDFIEEVAFDGEHSTFRSRTVTQIRAVPHPAGQPFALASPTGDGRLTTNAPRDPARPDRNPPEQIDPCRDRCLFTENVSTGEGYRGTVNAHVRIEVLDIGADRSVLLWARDNGATVAPLHADAEAGTRIIEVLPEHAARFRAGDVVVLEDEGSRLDPSHPDWRPVLRGLRAVDTATGRLELHDAGHALTDGTETQPPSGPVGALPGGGPLPRALRRADAAAVRRWDGADWLLTDVRYNLSDGIDFAVDGTDFRASEYWTFTARVTNPDGAARGVVEQRTESPVDGPHHERTLIGRLEWLPEGRRFMDLRRRFLPLHEVRDRLIELGREELAPGAFTVVVGDGVRTFGDIDQNLGEGVTGDEALQAAVLQLGDGGGTIYVRAGTYRLEHPVLLSGRSDIRILGDGAATRLEIRGAGGAFVIDRCGLDGAVSIELMELVENPAAGPGLGLDVLGNDLGGIIDIDRIRPLRIDDLRAGRGTVPDLVTRMATRVRDLRGGLGRAAASVVGTILELRRLQREQPDRDLEDIAADQLAVLRRLPHGVVSVADSSRIRLSRLTLRSSARAGEDVQIAAGVLITGTCSDIEVRECRIAAPTGIVATPLHRYLSGPALIRTPKAGLIVRHLVVTDNVVEAVAEAETGISIADGIIDGLVVEGNSIAGYPIGLRLEDRQETSPVPSDRSIVRRNRVTGVLDTGILVDADAFDLDANEVRLETPAEARPRRVGILVTGQSTRVRHSSVVLPPDGAARRRLGIEAGIVVGTGAAASLARPLGGVQISDNRIHGAGEATQADGILIGGAGPIFDVRIDGNDIRELGGSGIRAWSNAAPVGGLRVEGNTIARVALSWPRWDAQAVQEVRGIAEGVALDGVPGPKATLEALLAHRSGSVRVAVDAVLRYLERATLRGAIVFSGVEESAAYDNRIDDVGTTVRPPEVDGARARTAGVGVVGGRDVTVDRTTVDHVRGAVEREDRVVVPDIIRPPVFELLDRLDRTLIPSTAAVHGALAALRGDLARYGSGDEVMRSRLAGRIFGATESVAAHLAGGGQAGTRLAAELRQAGDDLREARNADDEARASTLLRAAVSDAAASTAPAPSAEMVWRTAARVDNALIASHPRGSDALDSDGERVAQDLAEAAGVAAEQAPEFGAGLADGGQRLADVARRVQEQPGDARIIDAFVAELGRVADARSAIDAGRVDMPVKGLTPGQAAVLDGLSAAIQQALGAGSEGLARLAPAVDALAKELDGVNARLSRRLAQHHRDLQGHGDELDERQIGALRETIDEVLDFARDPDADRPLRDEDIDAVREEFNGELALLTAQTLQNQLEGLPSGARAAVTRNLRLLQGAVGQLEAIVADQEPLAAIAAEIHEAVDDAVNDPANRTEHQATARRKLSQLQDTQRELTGVTIVQPAPGTAEGALSTRVAAVGQLAAMIADPDVEDAERAEALTRLVDHTATASEELALSAAQRNEILEPLSAAVGRLREERDEQAEHAVRRAIARLADHTAERSASPSADALKAYSAIGSVASDPTMDAETRLASAKAMAGARADVISSTLRQEILAAPTLVDLRRIADRGLAGLSKTRPLPRLRLPRQRVTVHPADGVFAAGVADALSISANTVASTRWGVIVGSPDDAPLAPRDARSVVVTIGDNTVIGATVGGLLLGTGVHTRATVSQNTVTACSGLLDAEATPFGQPAVFLDGRGELHLAGNSVVDNGPGAQRAEDGRAGALPAHAVVIRWHGDVTAGNNLIRHAGSAGGGGGLLVLGDGVDRQLVDRLTTAPFLAVEPPPRTIPPKFPLPTFPLPRFPLGPNFPFSLPPELTLGRVTPAFAEVAEAAPAPLATAKSAESYADRWIAPLADAVLGSIGDFIIRRFPPILVPLPLPARRSVHVVGNDVASSGPALLVLSGGRALVDVSVTGNRLRSSGDSGAAYLSTVASGVFAANRCENLGAVTVVALRMSRGHASVTGNVVIGDQPAAPTPTIPVRPVKPVKPTVSVAIEAVPGVGSVMVPIEADAILEAIREREDTSFSVAADGAKVEFQRFATRAGISRDPQVAELLARRDVGRILTLRLGRDVTTSDTGPANDVGLTGREREAEDPEPEVVRHAQENIDAVFGDPSLSAPAKLFGIANLGGLTEHQATAFVKTHMAAAGGNPSLALDKGVADLLGVEPAPNPGESIVAGGKSEKAVAASLLEALLSGGRFGGVWPGLGEGIIVDPIRPPILPPPPPDPRDHTLVVLGGQRVTATGNTTTAGVLVSGAAESVVHNL